MKISSKSKILEQRKEQASIGDDTVQVTSDLSLDMKS
jgi:hypothetical protein